MKQSAKSSSLIYFLLSIGTAHLAHSTPIINCPGISYLGASAHMTCNTSVPYTTLQYSRQSGGVFPQCVASSLNCSQEPGYVARTDSKTHTDLKILKVQPTHAGVWTCVVARSNSEASCSLFITNAPRCSISSDKNTDLLALHEDLALTVDIQEYYCSAHYSFTLLVGEAIVEQPVSESVNKPTNKTAITTVIVTASSLGGVQLVFLCHNEQQILSCDGIKFINVLPRCSITSGKATDTVALHEELDLTVDIQDYFCSSAYNFTLQVGDVRQPLFTSEKGDKLMNMTLNTTMNITDSYFGDVRLIFLCHDQQQVLTCQGLGSIKGNVATTSPSSSESKTILIAAVVSVIVIVAVFLTVVICCCCRHRVKQSNLTNTSYMHSFSSNTALENNIYIEAWSMQMKVA